MARTDTLGHFLTDVADAIRTAEGSSEEIAASDFDTRIEALSGGGLDWSAIGYTDMPAIIKNGYEYAKSIYNNWDSTITDAGSKYSNDKNLIYFPLVNTSNITITSSMFFRSNIEIIPLINTSNVTNMQGMFYQCRNLQEVPVLDTSSVTNMQNIFTECFRLSDASLDNILQMCINASSYDKSKTLSWLGFSSTYFSSSKIQALPHYQDFINAGWAIGYE